MKVILVSIMILIATTIVSANDISLNVERITLLTPPVNDLSTESSRIALFFEIPDSLDSRHIVYAEIVTELDLSYLDIEGISTIELEAFNIISDWNEGDSWNSLADNIDTLSFYSYTFETGDDSQVFMDITPFIKGITAGDNANFGLMLIPNKLDQIAFQINEGTLVQLRNNAKIKIVFQ